MLDESNKQQLRKSQYVEMLRIELANPKARRYHAYRWCFLGSIDHWVPLHEHGSLVALIELYAKHLNEESFFELM
ncbi:hypothetical protein SAMN05444166_3894 [Singulisphaera sp. GP187]|nr:hypothetical protein SAMN05444166_3894 [Singulisphaera sp. GP187]